jgi:hypothetical protein
VPIPVDPRGAQSQVPHCEVAALIRFAVDGFGRTRECYSGEWSLPLTASQGLMTPIVQDAVGVCLTDHADRGGSFGAGPAAVN